MFHWALITPLILLIILATNTSLSLDINHNPGGLRFGKTEVRKNYTPVRNGLY